MPSSMGSDELTGLKGRLRRLHARGVEGAEYFALIVCGIGSTVLTAGNLAQFALHGRLYIVAKGRVEDWAYWSEEPWTIFFHGVLNVCFLTIGLWMLAIVLAYPVTLLLWGTHKPAHTRLPPLSIKD